MKNNKVRIETIYKENDVYNEFELMKELKANNIVKERVELYRDFTVNLICYVHTSYFGKDYLKTQYDINGHFKWAFNKVIKEFEQESIVFKNTKELYEYFHEYFMHQFYNFEAIPPIQEYINFWDDIFNLNPKKQKSIMKVLTDLYLTFDTALDNKKTLIEI